MTWGSVTVMLVGAPRPGSCGQCLRRLGRAVRLTVTLSFLSTFYLASVLETRSSQGRTHPRGQPGRAPFRRGGISRG